LDSRSLRDGLSGIFQARTIAKVHRSFRAKAERRFPHLLDYDKDKTQQTLSDLQMRVETRLNEIFVDRCIRVLVPDLQIEIFRGVVFEMGTQIATLEVKDIVSYPFTVFVNAWENEAAVRLIAAVDLVNKGISKSPAFERPIQSMRMTVSVHVRKVEVNLNARYQAYAQSEQRKEQERLDAQFRADLANMSREEAEKRRREQERNAEAQWKLDQQLVRERLAFEHEMKMKKAELQRIEQQIADQQAARERAERERIAMERRLAAERAENERFWQNYHREQERAERARREEQERQLRQYKSSCECSTQRKSSGGVCNVY
jgi:hypothetical protein